MPLFDDDSDIVISLRGFDMSQGVSSSPRMRKSDDHNYIDVRTMSVREIHDRLMARSACGPTVVDSEFFAGGSALAWAGPARLNPDQEDESERKDRTGGRNATESAPVCPLVVFRRPENRVNSHEGVTAKTIYARPGDRMGFNTELPLAKRAAQSHKVDPSATFPPMPSALGSALQARRSIAETMTAVGDDPGGLLALTKADWGLPPDAMDLMEGLATEGNRELRGKLPHSSRQYQTLAAIETTKAFAPRVKDFIQESMKGHENQTLDIARIKALASSVAGIVVRRNPRAVSEMTKVMGIPGLGLGFHFTPDSRCSVSNTDPIGGLFYEALAGVDTSTLATSEDRSRYIVAWREQLRYQRMLAEQIAAQTARDRLEEDEEEAVLRVSLKKSVDKVLVSIASQESTKYVAMSMSNLIAEGAIHRVQVRRDFADSVRHLPSGGGRKVNAYLRFEIYIRLLNNPGLAAKLLKARPPYAGTANATLRACRDTMISLLIEAIPPALDRKLRSMLSATGDTNPSETLSYWRGKKESCQDGIIETLKDRSASSIYKWILASARAVKAENESLINHPLFAETPSELSDAVCRYVRAKLHSWVKTLTSHTTAEVAYVIERVKEGCDAYGDQSYTSISAVVEEISVGSGDQINATGEILDWDEDLPVTKEKSRSRNVVWYRHLVCRQLAALVMSSTVCSVSDNSIDLVVRQDLLLARVKSSILARKKNLATRFAHQEGEAIEEDAGWTVVTRKSGKAAVRHANEERAKMLAERAERRPPRIPGYTPDTCAIDPSRVRSCTSLKELVEYIDQLPAGYSLVSIVEATAAATRRMSKILSDVAKEYDSLVETLDGYEVNDDKGIVLESTSTSIFRSKVSTREVVLEAISEDEPGRSQGASGVADGDESADMEIVRQMMESLTNTKAAVVQGSFVDFHGTTWENILAEETSGRLRNTGAKAAAAKAVSNSNPPSGLVTMESVQSYLRDTTEGVPHLRTLIRNRFTCVVDVLVTAEKRGTVEDTLEQLCFDD